MSSVPGARREGRHGHDPRHGRHGPDGSEDRHRRVVVVGSGFGGALAAWPLVEEGVDVLMLERGPWVSRGAHNWAPEGTLTRTPYYDGSRYRARTDAGAGETGSTSCVGGPSVFYGGVSFRFREADFRPDPELVGDSGSEWPLDYGDLEPHYAEAERILSVTGRGGDDPTEPPRSGAYPGSPDDLSHVSGEIAGAARSLGLRPFRLPLAINYGRHGDRRPCVACGTCDTFACAVGAKNDLAARVIPTLMARGMELRSGTAVTGLHAEGGRVEGVSWKDQETGVEGEVTADAVILAAGALATPHLLLASGLTEGNPAGDVVGRYLTRHCSAIVFGGYPWMPRYEGRFHKQVGINDFYLGDPDGRGPPGTLGNIQQTQTPSMGTVEGELHVALAFLVRPLVRRSTGLLVIAEDRPRAGNRVRLDPDQRDELGLPRLVVEHAYHDRDLAARDALAARAKEVHRAAGSPATYLHEIDTFSHALGTVRMGPDPTRSPLDRECRYRGLENLWVTDGSALPTSAGVNPSLTIAANALRVGRILARRLRAAAAGASRGR
ncbi:MAG: FAD-binding protein [Gemmatimonadetes bacterium]|nr:GMC family oxidoreductase [Gemmatimonadota bacterium]NIR78816.1 GMC family oxidoreductase [Gemmatimonadota bacterium]NIT88085.1 GMC family oxidoreductase [Gemmatimonadota bacterium]NIU31915.1 GMC family oxidoreductase [Gemmatimonadota bacterium]NIU36010.1 FAD-binding protein [Gemmatimonadota bacterium]